MTIYPASSQLSGVNHISTGSILLDASLGIGGVPRGYITEISGNGVCGKSTLCQNIIIQAQKEGGYCAWIDTDHTFEPTYAAQCGVNLNDLFLVEPTSIEQVLEIINILLQARIFTTIIIDSIDTLVLASDLNTSLDFGPFHPTEPYLSRGLHNLEYPLLQSHTALILTHQSSIRASSVYHHLEQNPARLALPMMASIRLNLERMKTLYPNTPQQTDHIRIKVIKNRFYPCFKSIELDIIVNKGINISSEIFELGKELLILTLEGSDYYYLNVKIGSRRDNAVEFLMQHPIIAAEIEKSIRRKLIPLA